MVSHTGHTEEQESLAVWHNRIVQSIQSIDDGNSSVLNRLSKLKWMDAFSGVFRLIEINPGLMSGMNLICGTGSIREPTPLFFKNILRILHPEAGDIQGELDPKPLLWLADSWRDRVLYDVHYRREFLEWFAKMGLDDRASDDWVDVDGDDHLRMPRFRPFLPSDANWDVRSDKKGDLVRLRYSVKTDELLSKINKELSDYIRDHEFPFLELIVPLVKLPDKPGKQWIDGLHVLEGIVDRLDDAVLAVLTIVKALSEWLWRKVVDTQVYQDYMGVILPKRTEAIMRVLSDFDNCDCHVAKVAMGELSSLQQVLFLGVSSVGESFFVPEQQIVINDVLSEDQVNFLFQVDYLTERIYVQKEPTTTFMSDLRRNTFKSLISKCETISKERVPSGKLGREIDEAYLEEFLECLDLDSDSKNEGFHDLYQKRRNAVSLPLCMKGMPCALRKALFVFNEVYLLGGPVGSIDFEDPEALSLFEEYEVNINLKNPISTASFDSTKNIKTIRNLMTVGLFETYSEDRRNKALGGYPYYFSGELEKKQGWATVKKALLGKPNHYLHLMR